jgi:hypothetical protein
MTILPDFIILGAMKCGTSTLAAQLGAQNGIFMTDPKEPNYFSDDEIFARGPDWYSGLFATAAPGDLKGEASTHYTKRPNHPDTFDRMAAVIKAPRLVYMIRNPLDRAVSHYVHAWSLRDTSASIADAVIELPELFDFGCYGMQIEPFARHYGADAICLTSLEAMKRDPLGELAKVARHIGLDKTVSWKDDRSAENVSADRFRRLPMQRLLVDNPVAAQLRRRLVPKSLRDRIRSAREIPDRPQLPAATLQTWSRQFLEDRERLAAVFPDHPALSDAYPFAR